MNRKEQQLLQEEIGDTVTLLQVRTRTRIDVGLWWRRKRIWLCLTDRELVLLAIGRRRYYEHAALADCIDTHYNPTSGELVIASDNPLRHPRLRMPASTALEVIDLIKSQTTTQNTPTP